MDSFTRNVFANVKQHTGGDSECVKTFQDVNTNSKRMEVIKYARFCTNNLKEYNNTHTMASNVPMRTRSGRVSKPPDRYTPVEEVTDDYSKDEHDEDDSEDDSDYDESDVSEEETDDDEDADENGNLKDFVVDDEDEEA